MTTVERTHTLKNGNILNTLRYETVKTRMKREVVTTKYYTVITKAEAGPYTDEEVVDFDPSEWKVEESTQVVVDSAGNSKTYTNRLLVLE